MRRLWSLWSTARQPGWGATNIQASPTQADSMSPCPAQSPEGEAASAQTCPSTGKDRTSILFSVHDRPGSLVSALQAFDHCQINLSKIESRPSKRKDWEYIFYVDLAGHCEDEKVAEALEELNQHCSMVKLLGSYPDTGE